jgi:hypothetical protein
MVGKRTGQQEDRRAGAAPVPSPAAKCQTLAGAKKIHLKLKGIKMFTRNVEKNVRKVKGKNIFIITICILSDIVLCSCNGEGKEIDSGNEKNDLRVKDLAVAFDRNLMVEARLADSPGYDTVKWEHCAYMGEYNYCDNMLIGKKCCPTFNGATAGKCDPNWGCVVVDTNTPDSGTGDSGTGSSINCPNTKYCRLGCFCEKSSGKCNQRYSCETSCIQKCTW